MKRFISLLFLVILFILSLWPALCIGEWLAKSLFNAFIIQGFLIMIVFRLFVFIFKILKSA